MAAAARGFPEIIPTDMVSGLAMGRLRNERE